MPRNDSCSSFVKWPHYSLLLLAYMAFLIKTVITISPVNFSSYYAIRSSHLKSESKHAFDGIWYICTRCNANSGVCDIVILTKILLTHFSIQHIWWSYLITDTVAFLNGLTFMKIFIYSSYVTSICMHSGKRRKTWKKWRIYCIDVLLHLQRTETVFQS